MFDSCDYDRIGLIHINQLSGLLMKLGKNDGNNWININNILILI